MSNPKTSNPSGSKMSQYPIRDIAARYERRFARTFVASVNAQRRKITDELVARVMARGLVDEPRELYDLIDAIDIAKAEDAGNEAGVIAELISEAGRYEAKAQGHGRLMANLRITSPHVL